MEDDAPDAHRQAPADRQGKGGVLRCGRRVLHALASIRLTVVLLAAAMVLIFFGTLAQAELGVWAVIDGYFRGSFVPIDVALALPGLERGRVLIPWPAGGLLSALLIVNLLAAHAVRFRPTARRAGVLLVHAGLVVLLTGDLVAGALTREGVVRLDEGRRASAVSDLRDVELMLGDSLTAGERVRAAAASGDLLDVIGSELRLRIDRWMDNAGLLPIDQADGPGSEGRTSLATHGLGIELVADLRASARGIDDAFADTPAAYVTVLGASGDELGTWLLSPAIATPQTAVIGGRRLDLSLRFVEHELPFAVELVEASHEWFAGTDIPRSFTSRVRVIDRGRGVDRPAVIEMNRPLRYRGWSLYQSAYEPDGSGAVLHAVRNPGRVMPYVACSMMAGGLVWQFGWSLVFFVRQRGRGPAGRTVRDVSRAPGGPALWAVASLAIGGAILGTGFSRGGLGDEPGLAEFASLPVLAGGRVKPMDTAARHVVMLASGRQVVEIGRDRSSAVRFILKLAADPVSVADVPIVRVDEPGILALLGRGPGEIGLVSLAEIDAYWPRIASEAARASAVPERERDRFDEAAILLHSRASLLQAASRLDEPRVIAPLMQDGSWRPFTLGDAEGQASAVFFRAILGAWSEGDLGEFADHVSVYRALLGEHLPRETFRADVEVLFNRASLFMNTLAVYGLAALASVVAFVVPTSAVGRGLRVSASTLLVFGFVVHTVALVARVYLQERPPVTNLYSSAVLVGWGAVAAGLLFERVHRFGVAACVAAVVGGASLVVAHHLSGGGDTMQMMEAVLDSNFWLSTHVVTITLGYSASFLAGGLGASALVIRLIRGERAREAERSIVRLIYATVCAALLLSFTGTVLGGIWADRAWGRFWGWDPKENGAALIVLMHALILHARFGGMVRSRGVSTLAVLGNVVTAWSWFGTNLLGVGLHAYGFIDGAPFWLAVFCGANALVAFLAFVPDRAGKVRRA